jgi:glycosyltransferase involved in cell wall biosynthesis
MNSLDITVIILTYNEEQNIEECLESIKDITSNIFVVDSYSTDTTIDILRRYNVRYIQHEFINYSQQRNWAQQHNPFDTEWVFHLDADERFTDELRYWLKHDFKTEQHQYDGFMFSRRTIFMGRWIRHGGHYPQYHLRLFRSALGKCEDKAYDQHFIVKGPICCVNNVDIIDIVMTNIISFVDSHNRWSTFEALECVGKKNNNEIKANILGNPIEKKRWLKKILFEKQPLFLRSFFYFIYRYFLKLGFLDGIEGLIFHVLQGFWFRFLIDAKIYEMYWKTGKNKDSEKT